MADLPELAVHGFSDLLDELLGGYPVEGGRQANVHADLAAVRDDGVALPPWMAVTVSRGGNQ